MLDAALQKLLSVIDSLVPSNSHSGSGRAGSGAENNSSGGAAAGAGAGASPSTAATTSSSMPKHSLLYEASPAVPASAGKPARGPEYRVLAAKEGWPKLEGVTTLYELWTTSVEKYGPRRCLGWRPKVKEEEIAGRRRSSASLTLLDLFFSSTVSWPRDLLTFLFCIPNATLTRSSLFSTPMNEKHSQKP